MSKSLFLRHRPALADSGAPFISGRAILRKQKNPSHASAQRQGRSDVFSWEQDGLKTIGAAGIECVVDILDEEMKEVMGLLGVSSLRQLDKSYVSKSTPTNLPGVHSAFSLRYEGY